MAVFLVLLASSSSATEIVGKVSSVEGQSVIIDSSSDLLPTVGDKLEVFVEIPGVGKARVASATISSIENEVIRATIDKATGTVKPGQAVTIDSPKPTNRTRPRDGMQKWGTPIDPDGDCKITAEDGKLTIALPAAKHDLWFGGGGTFNAPRVLQDVEGDFVAQVKVTADWDTGVPPPTFYYNGAGLVVWDSEQQYLRLERNRYYNSRYGTISYVTPLYDRDEKRINGWKVAEDGFFRGRSTWLRIERSGKEFTTSISHDGDHWTTTAVLTTEFPDKVQLGVHAITISPRGFTAEFADFSITRGRPASIAATSSIPIEGWGKIIDPDDDCTMVATPSLLRITVSPDQHDLWYGRENPARRYNAPRVLQEVEGDFVARVKVTCADWLGPPLESGSFTRAAGLLIYESDQHYLRHERNRFFSGRQPDVVWSWTAPLYDRNGERISQWKSSREGPFQGDSTWLLMQRSGQTVHTWISHDGKQWTHTGTQTTTFPPKVQVGLIAHGSCSDKFTITFDEFKLNRK